MKFFMLALVLAAGLGAFAKELRTRSYRAPAEAVSIGPVRKTDACAIIKELQPVMSTPVGLTRATALLAYVKSQNLSVYSPSVHAVASNLDRSLVEFRAALTLVFVPTLTDSIQGAFDQGAGAYGTPEDNMSISEDALEIFEKRIFKNKLYKILKKGASTVRLKTDRKLLAVTLADVLDESIRLHAVNVLPYIIRRQLEPISGPVTSRAAFEESLNRTMALNAANQLADAILIDTVFRDPLILVIWPEQSQALLRSVAESSYQNLDRETLQARKNIDTALYNIVIAPYLLGRIVPSAVEFGMRSVVDPAVHFLAHNYDSAFIDMIGSTTSTFLAAGLFVALTPHPAEGAEHLTYLRKFPTSLWSDPYRDSLCASLEDPSLLADLERLSQMLKAN